MHVKRVAIVGSGCSGIGALWALKSTNHDVHLFEAADRLGGHTNTVSFEHNKRRVNVDTGFIVYNMATYPNLIRFFKTLGVNTVPTDMTFGVSRDQGAFEWAGTSLGAVFAQRKNIFSLRMWRMIFDIVRFNQFALDLLHEADESEEDPSGAEGVDKTYHKPQRQESIGEYLDRQGYSDAFRDDYLMPMTAAVWSTGPDKCAMEFPALTLVRFMWNHHLLSTVSARPDWMTLPGGSQQYIDAVLKDFPKQNVHLACPVKSVQRKNGRVVLQFDGADAKEFDHVIMACHGDQTMEVLKSDATDEESSILGSFHTTENVAYLHSDLSLMPRRRLAWSSWNLMMASPPPKSSKTTESSVCLTYNMNILQHIPTSTYGDILVTLNPIHLPSASTIQGRWTYHHPLYTADSIRAQKLLPRIQNTSGISYAGAWTKYGFHEDGFSSGLKVAIEHLGAELPWEFVDSTFSRGRRPVLGFSDYAVRIVILYIQIMIACVDYALRIISLLLGARTDKRKKLY